MNLLQNQNMQNMPHQQRGALLIVGLVMVLLMTIVGMAAIRGTGLQENMAGNMRDRNASFQAAESALREGEAIVAPINRVLPPSDGTKGLFPDQSADPAKSVIYWTEAKWVTIATKSLFAIKGVATPPRYIVEEIYVSPSALAALEGNGIDVDALPTTGAPTPYRISARGVGVTVDTETVLQSIFARRFQ
jgi:type IV pilus assembly protein PilX